MAKKKIRGNWGVLLSYIGKLYGTPANAIKEYTSNALDEWRKAREKGEMESVCEVTYSLEKGRITIDYNSPGMDEKEFENALNRVAESVKLGSSIPQIGQLGIGIFAFNQIGNTCTFYSKKAKGSPTVKVKLMSNSENYDIDKAAKHESRQNSGMTVIIAGLHQDPTKPRGSLAPYLLQRSFAEKFDSYLRQGYLKVKINCGGKTYEVKPIEINLPKVGEAFSQVPLSTDRQKQFDCQFWFDASGKSRVSIRHTGVSIIEDLKNYPAYGLEESVYASGFLKGYIDADFLKPLPARTSFEENRDWVQFLVELDKICSSLEAEIEELRQEEEEKKLTEVQKKAIEIAREVLNQEQFRDLELLAGLSKRRSPVVHPGETHKEGQKTGEHSKKEGEQGQLSGFRIAYQEIPFEDGTSRHSRFLSGIVQANELNPDFRREVDYGALMIGKEAIIYNDKSGGADYFLEKLLSYMFQVQLKTRKGR
ncbi:MAG: ATP-binding protein [Chloroflexi bacterium]|nr:ATP-binding protein [Chloroflexota bacterium]